MLESKIEFPCSYPIKVIGVADKVSYESIYRLSKHQFKTMSEKDIVLKHSKNRNYVSYHLDVVVESEKQLKELHQSLMELDGVKMVL